MDNEKLEKKRRCPDGPCCTGEDCCTIPVFMSTNTAEKEEIFQDIERRHQEQSAADRKKKNFRDSISNGYLAIPDGDKDSKTCIVKLVTSPGFQIAVDFKKMDMLESTDGGCTEDYVKIWEKENENNKRTFGVFGNFSLFIANIGICI